MNNVRVRFAPSPTGPLHIGGVRTALYNYLFAKKHGGEFILRIEDTDQTRYVANAETYIIDALEWCGLYFDEGPDKNEKYGPYRQSERKAIYKQYVDQLVANGNAYYAFDTNEELDRCRQSHESDGKTFIYNWHNRNKLINSTSLSKEEVEQRIANGDAYVIRFMMYQPEIDAATLDAEDLIRGHISFKRELLDDKVLFKSDGMPTYHLANIVDDHLMSISHVIRGEEWLPSLPLHIALYEALDWTPPHFAHLPLILKPVGKGKLSKRDGDKLGFPVFPLNYTNDKNNETSRGYREDGYLPEAFINMLALLGWNPGTEKELFSLEELSATFSLDRVSKSGAKFSPDKTNWFNQQYLQKTSNSVLTDLFLPILKERGIASAHNYVKQVVSLVKERAVFVHDLWDLSHFFFVNPSEYEPKATRKQWKPFTAKILTDVMTVLQGIEDFSSENTEKVLKEWMSSEEIGFGKVMQPLRLSLVGALKGPHLFDIIALIGKENSLERIATAIDNLG